MSSEAETELEPETQSETQSEARPHAARDASDEVSPDALLDEAPDDSDEQPAGDTLGRRAQRFIAGIHPAMWITLTAALIWAILFGRLGIRRHDTFGTWAFDLGIYDQGYWLVSRGQSFMTVRGLDFWGHHVNLVAYLYAPFYWLGAGPRFLIASQAAVLAAGAIPTYLLARDRVGGPWVGLTFAVVYLMYAPVQWIAWANYHPEALVVTPLLFSWWFATQRRWRPFYIALVLALITREDTALAITVMGVVLWWMMRRDPDADQRDRRLAIGATVLGVIWYLVATRLVLPGFNRGQQPFYIGSFYGSYGSNMFEIAETVLTRPDRVVSDATQTDRLRFYRDLLLPWGGLPLGGLAQLAMAGPQMLASVIGSSPYARSIRYQYTSVMIAPIVIASIEAARWMWRFGVVRRFLIPWLLICAYVTNIAWSPSPISANESVWGGERPEHATMRTAVEMVPDDATVSATYALGPHLSHREQIYDWPNPWVPAYWGNDDTYGLPDPSVIEYVVLDRRHVGPDQQDLLVELIGPDGEFEVLLDSDTVVVGRRR